ncbi:hypothetical protein N7449_001946 [Penicillium cf. viridicatum]|uniref:Xylanolytic transcriptional activator regulatory domain-containing protein n=1 Tax=Penicillium cf. viridicatum TaxID=2972119 RepID=A0A9W9N7R7_9EURO|nr:hypothetical protein N7449_001946 [Penicillium cf. viridicatum]
MYRLPAAKGEDQQTGSGNKERNQAFQLQSPSSGNLGTAIAKDLLSDDLSNQSSLAELVGSLRTQLNNVESIVRAYSNDVDDSGSATSRDPAPSEPAQPAYQRLEGFNADSNQRQRSHERSNSSPASCRFCGPTSPDYSMNFAQMTLRERGYLGQSVRRPIFPSVDGDVSPSPTSQWQPLYQSNQRPLLQFKNWLTLQEAKDVVLLYHEVVGELHPFVDSRNVENQLDFWYSHGSSHSPDQTNQRPDDEDLVILNLVLAIAAQAQADALHAKFAGSMHSTFQHTINTLITSYSPSIKQVAMVLLLGYYYFSQDLSHLALRMCGTAGRILMELGLGLDNSDVLKYVLKSEAQRREASTMICLVVVLDRQWSAVTGLPPNFSNASFHPMSAYLTDSSYTMAMSVLVPMSGKFSEPISLIAKGKGYLDDEAFELIHFQIQQWQKKFVGDRNLSDMETWFADPSTMPPLWVVLLIFRAASIRSLLFRPYFFPISQVEKSKKLLVPVTELLSSAIEALFKLDSITTVYRKQRPYYQHILASICALLFLMTGYVEDRRIALSPHLPLGYDDKIRRCLQMAFKLAEKYSNVSRAAGKLQKRIVEVRHALDTYSSWPLDAERSFPTTFEHGLISTDPASMLQQAPAPCAEARGDPARHLGIPFGETGLYSSATNWRSEFSTDSGSGVLQDNQAWGLPTWSSNLDSFLLQ